MSPSALGIIASGVTESAPPPEGPIVIESASSSFFGRNPVVTFSNPPLADDLVIVWSAVTDSGFDYFFNAAPAGWVNPLGGGTSVTASASCKLFCVYHIVTAAEEAADKVDYGPTDMYDGNPQGNGIGVIVRNANILSLAGTGTTSGTASPHVLAAATPIASGGLVLSGVARANTTAYTDAPTGWTFCDTETTTISGAVLSYDTATTQDVTVGPTNITAASSAYASISLVFEPQLAGIRRVGASTSGDTNGAASNTKTVTRTVTAGNGLIVCIAMDCTPQTTSPVTSVSDGANAYAQVDGVYVAQPSIAFDMVDMWVCPAVTSAGSKTITVTFMEDVASAVVVIEVSGHNKYKFVDKVASDVGTLGGQSSGATAATSPAGTFVVGFVSQEVGITSHAFSTGLTSEVAETVATHGLVSGPPSRINVYDGFLSSSGIAETFSSTMVSNNFWANACVTFNQARTTTRSLYFRNEALITLGDDSLAGPLVGSPGSNLAVASGAQYGLIPLPYTSTTPIISGGGVGSGTVVIADGLTLNQYDWIIFSGGIPESFQVDTYDSGTGELTLTDVSTGLSTTIGQSGHTDIQIGAVPFLAFQWAEIESGSVTIPAGDWGFAIYQRFVSKRNYMPSVSLYIIRADGSLDDYADISTAVRPGGSVSPELGPTLIGALARPSYSLDAGDAIVVVWGAGGSGLDDETCYWDGVYPAHIAVPVG